VTVENYLNLWCQLSPRTPLIIPAGEAARLDGRMAGVRTVGNTLGLAQNRALPMGGAGGAVPVAPASQRNQINEDNFESEWSEWFRSEDQAMAWWRAHGGLPRRVNSVDGFLVCSTTGAPCKQKMEAVERFRSGKKTANMPSASKMQVGEKSCRRYVAYEDINDAATAVFCVHYIKRVV
jgi:hypothetical protein